METHSSCEALAPGAAPRSSRHSFGEESSYVLGGSRMLSRTDLEANRAPGAVNFRGSGTKPFFNRELEWHKRAPSHHYASPTENALSPSAMGDANHIILGVAVGSSRATQPEKPRNPVQKPPTSASVEQTKLVARTLGSAVQMKNKEEPKGISTASRKKRLSGDSQTSSAAQSSSSASTLTVVRTHEPSHTTIAADIGIWAQQLQVGMSISQSNRSQGTKKGDFSLGIMRRLLCRKPAHESLVNPTPLKGTGRPKRCVAEEHDVATLETLELRTTVVTGNTPKGSAALNRDAEQPEEQVTLVTLSCGKEPTENAVTAVLRSTINRHAATTPFSTRSPVTPKLHQGWSERNEEAPNGKDGNKASDIPRKQDQSKEEKTAEILETGSPPRCAEEGVSSNQDTIGAQNVSPLCVSKRASKRVERFTGQDSLQATGMKEDKVEPPAARFCRWHSRPVQTAPTQKAPLDDKGSSLVGKNAYRNTEVTPQEEKNVSSRLAATVNKTGELEPHTVARGVQTSLSEETAVGKERTQPPTLKKDETDVVPSRCCCWPSKPAQTQASAGNGGNKDSLLSTDGKYPLGFRGTEITTQKDSTPSTNEKQTLLLSKPAYMSKVTVNETGEFQPSNLAQGTKTPANAMGAGQKENVQQSARRKDEADIVPSRFCCWPSKPAEASANAMKTPLDKAGSNQGAEVTKQSIGPPDIEVATAVHTTQMSANKTEGKSDELSMISGNAIGDKGTKTLMRFAGTQTVDNITQTEGLQPPDTQEKGAHAAPSRLCCWPSKSAEASGVQRRDTPDGIAVAGPTQAPQNEGDLWKGDTVQNTKERFPPSVSGTAAYPVPERNKSGTASRTDLKKDFVDAATSVSSPPRSTESSPTNLSPTVKEHKQPRGQKTESATTGDDKTQKWKEERTKGHDVTTTMFEITIHGLTSDSPTERQSRKERESLKTKDCPSQYSPGQLALGHSEKQVQARNAPFSWGTKRKISQAYGEIPTHTLSPAALSHSSSSPSSPPRKRSTHKIRHWEGGTAFKKRMISSAAHQQGGKRSRALTSTQRSRKADVKSNTTAILGGTEAPGDIPAGITSRAFEEERLFSANPKPDVVGNIRTKSGAAVRQASSIVHTAVEERAGDVMQADIAKPKTAELPWSSHGYRKLGGAPHSGEPSMKEDRGPAIPPFHRTASLLPMASYYDDELMLCAPHSEHVYMADSKGTFPYGIASLSSTSAEHREEMYANAKEAGENEEYEPEVLFCTLCCLLLITLALLLLALFLNFGVSSVPRTLPETTAATTPAPAAPSMVAYYCSTAMCNKEGEYIRSLLSSHKQPCENFYQYVCDTWSKYHPHDASDTGSVVSTDTLLESSIAQQTLPFLVSAAQSDVKQASSLYQACTDRSKIGTAVESARETFQQWTIGHWPRTDASSTMADVWRFAGELVRDLRLAGIVGVGIGVNPDNLSLAALELSEPELIFLRGDEVHQGLGKLFEDTIKETAEIFGADTQIQEKLVSDVMPIFRGMAYAAEGIDVASGSSTTHCQRVQDLDGGIQTFLKVVFNRNEVKPSSPVVLRSPHFVCYGLPNAMNQFSPEPVLNYLGFLVLVRMAPFLPESLQGLRQLFSKSIIGRTNKDVSDVALMCLRAVDHLLPSCVGKAQAQFLASATSDVSSREWMSQLETLFGTQISQLHWVDELSALLVRYRMKRWNLITYSPLWAQGACFPTSPTSWNTSTPFHSYRSLSVLLQQQLRQEIHRVGDNCLWRSAQSALSTRPTYDHTRQVVYVPAGLINTSVPASSSVFSFHLARVAVRVYRALAEILFDDNIYVSETALHFTEESNRRLKKLLSCFERDTSFLPNASAKISSSAAGHAAMAQTVALFLGFRAYRELLHARRIWQLDFRFKALPNVSSDMLFFLYYAIDNCESADSVYRSARERSRLSAEHLVNIPLRHMVEFRKLFDCKGGSRMAVPTVSICEVGRPLPVVHPDDIITRP